MPILPSIVPQLLCALVQPFGLTKQTTLNNQGTRILKYCLTQDLSYSLMGNNKSVNSCINMDSYIEMIYVMPNIPLPDSLTPAKPQHPPSSNSNNNSSSNHSSGNQSSGTGDHCCGGTGNSSSSPPQQDKVVPLIPNPHPYQEWLLPKGSCHGDFQAEPLPQHTRLAKIPSSPKWNLPSPVPQVPNRGEVY
jgi:hypothetical protein